MLAAREQLVRNGIALTHAVLLRQELHREVHALELAGTFRSANRALASHPADSTTASNSLRRARDAVVYAHINARAKLQALALHLAHARVDEVLFHLEVRDAIAQQTADAIIALEQHAPNDLRAPAAVRNAIPAGPVSRSPPTLLPVRVTALGTRRVPAVLFHQRAIRDLPLDLLDRDRLFVDVQNTGFFTRRFFGHTRPVISGKLLVAVQAHGGLFPAVAVHEVVPVRNDVSERTAQVTERDAAVHAAGTLIHQLRLGQTELELFPVLEPITDGLARRLFAFDL